MFSHIYVEERILHNNLTKTILSRLGSKRRIIEIQHYKDVFNRKGQDFLLQKESPKLILAEREGNFYYKGSYLCNSYGHENFYYTSQAMNCLYHCHYCYLQGIYPSGNMVLFVNIEDTIDALADIPAGSLICPSYDTDLLSIEHLTGFVKRFYEYCRENPENTMEIRTKSVNFRSIAGLKPINNFVLSYTLSPEEICRDFEQHAPGFAARLRDVKKAVSKGFRVRICIDPVIYTDNYAGIYKEMIDNIFSCLGMEAEGLTDVSFGMFRIPTGHIKRIRKRGIYSKVLAYPFEISEDGKSCSYTKEHRKDMMEFIKGELLKYIPEEKVICFE